MIKYIKNILAALVVTAGLFSCEQERLDPVLTTAQGGGTLNEYMAYTIASTDPSGSNVYGRIVFWKDNLERTLVQVSLYNTVPGLKHPALIIEGMVGSGTTTLVELDDVSGDSGELDANKFFIIADTDFYSSIPEMDAHINIYLSDTDDTIVATGDLGANADPVESN
ncbi:hypothetical protein [Zobellia uliginosa]|uniref:hypothetical protein n=1 Tax=Zobellia uliginosa TaxID=143224 RepID=UPI0026E2ACA2|nr:hypothetical protein [Zobellia uliginosa]MDO6519757.1 hypothetical protein [Zobellia uliginosa]